MCESKTYLGASSRHLHCENYSFEPNTPLKVFNRDETCTQITWIDIRGCSGILDKTTFNHLPNLEIINLDKCNIESVEEGAFSALPNLKSIEIRKSNVPLDQNTFKNCQKLDHIRFIQVENSINKPLIFKDLTNLTNLTIDHIQGFKVAKDTFAGLENLQYLFIQYCEIDGSCEGLFEPLKSLETLYFRGNKLESLSHTEFLCLGNLKTLGIHDNSPKSLEKPLQIDYQQFESLPHLDTINFPGEALKTMKFEGFKCLKTVRLIIGAVENDIVEDLEKRNIGVEWTSGGSDLTEDIDFNDPNIQICA